MGETTEKDDKGEKGHKNLGFCTLCFTQGNPKPEIMSNCVCIIYYMYYKCIKIVHNSRESTQISNQPSKKKCEGSVGLVLHWQMIVHLYIY